MRRRTTGPTPLALAVALALVLPAEVAVVLVGPTAARQIAPAAPTPIAHRPSPPPPVLATAPRGAPLPGLDGLAAALRRPGAAAALGPRPAAVVIDARQGRRLYGRQSTLGAAPASTLKLVTAAAALATLGPNQRLTTAVVRGGGNRIVLVGGGDPTLGTAGWRRLRPGATSLAALAAATARRLRTLGIASVRLGLDASRFRGPRTAPGWKPNYVADGEVAPVTALMVDEGQVRPDRPFRFRDPVAAAGRAFAALLRRAGTRVTGPPGPAPGAHRPALAAVSSRPVSGLVEDMLTASDNDLAEALAREVAGHLGLPRSFAGVTKALPRALATIGVQPRDLYAADGSGLSTLDRLSPLLLARLLTAVVGRPTLRAVLSGLPVAGFTGTLADRFDQPASRAGLGAVRAKTGTLRGVSALAGIVVDRDGALLAFAFLAASTAPQSRVERALDVLAATLSRCGCR